ncbi:hypothetical protein M6B38_222780 [Iris pallida]|uniref:Uncharacterized protein n=1 Tax=Iris pallida TaxID=29817 RepID=A0AAX6DWX6_IRIPA|nr:hypothetical protein M6B38_222780 [Iris pallida]
MLRKNHSSLAPRFSRRRLTHARSKGEEMRVPSLFSLNISFSSQTTPCSLTSPVIRTLTIIIFPNSSPTPEPYKSLIIIPSALSFSHSTDSHNQRKP